MQNDVKKPQDSQEMYARGADHRGQRYMFHYPKTVRLLGVPANVEQITEVQIGNKTIYSPALKIGSVDVFLERLIVPAGCYLQMWCKGSTRPPVVAFEYLEEEDDLSLGAGDCDLIHDGFETPMDVPKPRSELVMMFYDRGETARAPEGDGWFLKKAKPIETCFLEGYAKHKLCVIWERQVP